MCKFQAISSRERIRQRLQSECESFQHLDSSMRRQSILSFEDRQKAYVADQCSNKDIYLSSCDRLGVGVNEAFAESLGVNELVFEASVVNASQLNVGPVEVLGDLLLMNPVQYLILRDSKLTNEGVKFLCETLLKHEFISVLDFSANTQLGVQSAHAITALVENNPHVIRVLLSGTGISPELAKRIAAKVRRQSQEPHIR